MWTNSVKKQKKKETIRSRVRSCSVHVHFPHKTNEGWLWNELRNALRFVTETYGFKSYNTF